MKMNRGNFLKLFSTGALGLAVFPFKASWGGNPSMPEVFAMDMTEQIRHGASEYDVVFRGGKFSTWLQDLIKKRYLRNGYEPCADDLIEISGTVEENHFSVRRLKNNLWVSGENRIVELFLDRECDDITEFDSFSVRVFHSSENELILNNVERGVVIPLSDSIYLNEQWVEKNEFAASDDMSYWNINGDNGISVLIIQPK